MHTVKRDTSSEAFRGLHRLPWKSALKSVLGAAWRVHHYRDVHTSMVREALCDLDCGRQQQGCDDE